MSLPGSTSGPISSNLSVIPLCYSKIPPLHLQYLLLEEKDTILAELQANLLKAQDKMKSLANKHRREVQYEEGDWVFPKIQLYKHKFPARKMNEKPSPQYYGPFQIAKEVGGVAYKLELPQIHESIQCSMSHYYKRKSPFQPMLNHCCPQLTDDWKFQVKPETVIAVRSNVAGEGLDTSVGLPSCEDTWESFHLIQQYF